MIFSEKCGCQIIPEPVEVSDFRGCYEKRKIPSVFVFIQANYFIYYGFYYFITNILSIAFCYHGNKWKIFIMKSNIGVTIFKVLYFCKDNKNYRLSVKHVNN